MMAATGHEAPATSILLAGGPGSGKSTISQRLRDQGVLSIDLDFGYARWEDRDGDPARFPAAPSRCWLRSHRWRWRVDLLDAVIAEAGAEPVVYAGTASNMFDILNRFDRLLLLQMDDQTRRKRLADPQRQNAFGRVGDTADWSAWWHRTVEAEMIGRNAAVIDANRPIDQVVVEVGRYITQ